MDISIIADLFTIANGMGKFLGYLPKVIGKIQRFKTKSGSEIKASDETIGDLNEYLNSKKRQIISQEERKLCKAILKKHNLPKNVGIMCKSKNDICFMPNKAIVNKNLNNLSLKSSDETANLFIGGGFFVFYIKTIVSGIVHEKVMNGTVIEHKGEIYLLRHPLGGSPYYLAKLDLFINGMIIELDDGFKIGLYY